MRSVAPTGGSSDRALWSCLRRRAVAAGNEQKWRLVRFMEQRHKGPRITAAYAGRGVIHVLLVH